MSPPEAARVLDRGAPGAASGDAPAPLHLAFVGSAVPARMGAGTRAFSPAGNGFQTSLLRELRGGGATVEALCMRPMVAYPGDRVLVHTGASVELDGGGGGARLVPFLNLRGAKEGSLALSFLARLGRWAATSPRGEPRALLVYNVFSPLALPVLAVARAWRIPAVAIVADLPVDLYRFQGMRGLLERMDYRAQLASLRRFDGLIALTRHIAEDFAPCVPRLLMEGALSSLDGDDGSSPSAAAGAPSGPRVVMYSGMLNEMNGTATLLEAFSRLPEPDWQLHVYGGGPLFGAVEAAALRDPRIALHHWDDVSAAEVRRRQREATVLVNPRPAGHGANRYTFPSKLMEYLASGTVTVSTAPPGIPEEYHPHLELARDDSAASLAEAVRRAAERSPAERAVRGARARAWVLREKSWARQGERIGAFLRTVASGEDGRTGEEAVAGRVRAV